MLRQFLRRKSTLKNQRAKWIGLISMFFIMISTLVPMSVAAGSPTDAGKTIRITYPMDSKTAASATDNEIPTFTTSQIDVVAYFSNMSSTEAKNIAYEVDNLTTGDTGTPVTINPPVISGSNQITFHNVQLTEGKNRIVLMLNGQEQIKFSPVYAYYTSVPRISGIKVGPDSYKDGAILPVLPARTLTVSGDVYNAESVTAYLNGDTSGKHVGVIQHQFTFTAEDKTNSQHQTQLQLNPGDNTIVLSASNSGDSYTYTKKIHFVYNNGNSFVYGVTGQYQDVNNNTQTVALDQAKVTNSSVSITSYLKVNVNKISGVDVADPSSATVQLNGNPTSAILDLRNLTSTHSGDTLTKLDSLSKPGQYEVLEYTSTLSLDTTQKVQTLNYSFQGGTNKTNATYTFYYENPSDPYIDYAEQIIGSNGSGLRLSSNQENEISSLPLKLNVYANQNTKGIQVYTAPIGSTSFTPVTAAVQSNGTAANGDNVYTIDLTDAIKQGTQQVKIVPEDSNNDPAPYNNSLHWELYQLNVINVPYVIVNNFYDGQVINSPSELVCGISSPCIQGRLVNVTDAQLSGPNPTYRVEIAINGGAPVLLNNAVQSGQAVIQNSNLSYVIPALSNGSSAITDGENTIQFKIYENSSSLPIEEADYRVYLFTAGSAGLTLSSPMDENGSTSTFVGGQNPGTYVTELANSVKITGQFTANTTQNIKLTVLKTNPDGSQDATYDQYQLNNSGYWIHGACYDTGTGCGYLNTPDTNGSFTTTDIPLQDKGQTTLEFTATNSAGISTIKTIVINRQPAPFSVTKPILTSSNTVTVNSNFIQVEIHTEGADSVVFGRGNQASKESDPNYFQYEVDNLRQGNNTVQFTVNIGKQKFTGKFTVYYSNQPIIGAEYKTPLSNRLSLFNNDFNLKFPRGTMLENKSNQLTFPNRNILVGIADPTSGQVDQASGVDPVGKQYLADETGRFRTISHMYWVDGGVVPNTPANLTRDYYNKIEYGSGIIPYPTDYSNVFYLRNPNQLVEPSERGTLTMSFDPNMSESAWRYITVEHFETYLDDQGIAVSKWVNLGGVVDMKNHTITIPFDSFGYYQVMYMYKSFDDVISHSWARNDLDILYSRGIMTNKSTNLFMPNDSISRGEFVSMLVKIFDIPLNYEGPGSFVDVYKRNPSPGQLYDYKYIETAARAGIVRGNQQALFAPNNSLTREQAAAMIARAANLKMKTVDDPKLLNNLLSQYTDGMQISIYFRPAVETVTKAGLMSGIPNVAANGIGKTTYSFSPGGTLTRAEASSIAVKVLRMEKKIP